ncbi:MAG: CHAT domain-containing protein [Sphingomonas sp.]|uniref:CHAT domain-containing protein n=1 Tax=Sphingomonas sp. TaxID=28214 RepID=UPI0025FFD640|nr:CHAT domain-containing protein [Sphingomonas sp.]MBX3566310.1 CHAT domain-containing protein [Sphingomonas sp.]
MDEDLPRDFEGLIRHVLSGEDAGPGNVQLICLPIGHWSDRIGTFFAYLLLLHQDEQRVFERLRLIVPPGTDEEDAARFVAEAADATYTRAGNPSAQDGRVARLQARIEVVVAASHDADVLLALAQDAPADRAVAVVEAAGYRVPGLANATPEEGEGMLGSDETWAPHLEQVAQSLGARAGEGYFFLLDLGLFKPSGPVLAMLQDIPNCAILTGSLDDPEAAIDARMPDWRRLMIAGQIGQVLQELDAIDGLDAREKEVVRIQLLDGGGLKSQALAALREFDCSIALPPSVAVKFAHIAAEGGASALADMLLRPVAADLTGREALQTALLAAGRIGDAALGGKIEALLAAEFPGSEVLRDYCYRRAVGAGDHAGAAAVMAGVEGAGDAVALHLALADAFAGPGLPDYDALVSSAGGDAELAVKYLIMAAADALRRGALVHALELSLDPRLADRPQGSGTLLGVLEQLLINRPGGVMAVTLDRIEAGIALLCRRLASAPANGSLRAGLIDLLEPGVAGDDGLPIVLAQMLSAASRPQFPSVAPELPDVPALGALYNLGLREAVERWVEAQAPIQVGRTPFPVDDLPADPGEIATAVYYFLADSAEHGIMADQDLSVELALGAALAPYAARPDLDLVMIRTSAVGLAMGGAHQPARDLAEMLLQRADTPRRRRLAWFGLADIYHRCDNRLLSALYATLGILADDAVDDDQLWHETLTLARVLRDNGLTPHADQVLAAAEALLTQMGQGGQYGHRITTMRLLNRLRAGTDGDAVSFIAGLRTEAIANGRIVVERGDMPAPAAMLLSQLNRFARELGMASDPEAERLADALHARLGGRLGDRVAVYGRDAPGPDDLLTLLRTSQDTRYSDDVGKDAHDAALTARRALAADALLADPAWAALALELCCDRAIAAPGWDGLRVPPPAPASGDALAETARHLSNQSLSLVQAAFANDDSLVKLVAQAGDLHVSREDKAGIDLPGLRSWKERYPFAYGTADLDANRFYTSTEELRIADVPAGATVLIGDTHLRSLPPTLLRIGDRFAGEQQAMAAAPSLGWLHAAQNAQSLGDGRRLAWISDATTKGTTLATLADRMEDSLTSHGFLLDRGSALPTGFAGASMAILAAHGSLNREASAFQVVSDEGRLAVSAGDLAAALHNVGIVILFVCSGGRSDAHPAADATLGLARDLLDHGVQAVIASPWPLESIVPPPWLDAFLPHWAAGDRLINAVHAANQAMFARWPHDYAKGLAMNLFGNPLLRA